MVQPNPEHGPDAPYEIIKERDAADYIPLGMELTIDGRRMKIDSVNFQAGTVSLKDLDNNAFKANAGTEVVSDIIFLQKRDRPAIEQPGWVQVGENEDGYKINSYFLEHPEMVLGQPTSESTQYGRQDYTVAPIDGADLSQQLAGAVQNLAPPDRELLEIEPEQEDGKEVESIHADPSVRNFSYALFDGKLYFRENSRMKPVDLGKKPTERAMGIIAIRDSARKLIDLQMENAGDDAIKAEQANLMYAHRCYWLGFDAVKRSISAGIPRWRRPLPRQSRSWISTN